jgi:hypothetical protein
MGQSFTSAFSDSPFGEYWDLAERYERDRHAHIDGVAGNQRRNNSPIDEARTALVMRSSEANLNETHKNLIAEPAEIIAFISLNETEAKKVISRYAGSMRSTDTLEEFSGFNHLLVEKFVSVGLGYKLTSLEYNQEDFSKLTKVLLQWLFPYSELVQQHYFNDLYTLVKKEYDSQHGEELNTVQQIILFVARLLQLPKDLLVFLLKKLAVLLSELKLENKRYWLPGNRNEKGRLDYTPLLPVNIQGPYELVEKAFSKIDSAITLFLGEPHDEVNDSHKKGVLAFLRHYYGEIRKTLREFNGVVKELVTTLQEAVYILNAFIVGIYNGVINLVTGFIRLVAVVLDLMDAERLRLFLEGLKKLRAQIREKGFLTFMKTMLSQLISELKKRYSSDKGIYELAKNLGEDLAELIVDTIIALATGGATIIDKIKVFLKELLELIRNPKKKLSDVADYLKRKGARILTGSGGVLRFTREISRNVFAQEEPMSCMAACVRQLIKDLGIHMSEAEVRILLKTADDGTFDDNVIPALKKIFKEMDIVPVKAGSRGDLAEDAMKISRHGSWIASIHPIGGMRHSVIVDRIVGKEVFIRDPWPKEGIGLSPFGVEGTVDLDEFLKAWNFGFTAAFYLKK